MPVFSPSMLIAVTTMSASPTAPSAAPTVDTAMILNRCALKNSTYMPTSSFGCCTRRTRGLLRADIVRTRSATELVVPLMMYVSRRLGVWRHVGLESTRNWQLACRRTDALLAHVTAVG